MSEKKTIEHSGFVESISEDGVMVRFVSQSACADCQASGVCSASDMQDKEVLIKDNTGNYHTGERVRIVMTSGQGSRAVLMGYVYPFILFLIVLLILSASGLDEVKAGIISLLILVPYYAGIYLFRERINKDFNFSIRKEG